MGTLYIVATPIGNLEDITLRALKILKEADAVLAEDSRVAGRLLHHFNIKKPIIIFHEHSDKKRLQPILGRLNRGENLAYLTDAGTPAVSDPGGRLAALAWEAGIKISPVPGASALTALLSAAGLPIKDFVFLGFLPKKKGRQTLFTELKRQVTTKFWRPLLIFESPLRLISTLKDLKNALGDREAAVGREMTKKFEEIQRGRLSWLIDYFSKSKTSLKGEITLIVG